jgi:hypothetical protein
MLGWDWKETVDLTRLAAAISRVVGKDVHVTYGETDGDWFAVIVSDIPLTPEEATELVQNWPDS